MDILISFDEAYALPAGVMLSSLANVVAPGTCTVHAVSVGIGASTRAAIERSAGGLTLCWNEPDLDLLAGADVSSSPGLTYISRTTLCLLLLDTILPRSVERVLAIDVDTLVRHDPAPLATADLNGHAIGGVRDAELTTLVHAVPTWRRFDLDPSAPYFNAGVLLIDRRAWSEGRLGERSLELLRRYPGALRYNEQDALNVVCGGGWQSLPWRWNFQVPLEAGLGGDAAALYGTLGVDDLDEARRDPGIVHYSGVRKPWYRGSEGLPFVREWEAAKARTPWAGSEPVRRPTSPAARVAGRRLAGAARILLRGS